MSGGYEDHDAVGLAALVAAGEATPAELLEAALSRAEALDPRLNCIASLAPDVARRQIAAGLPPGPLSGAPFLLKDLGAEAADLPASGGSRLLRGARSPADSALVVRLRRAGLVLFGRTTSPEGGVGVTTEAQLYGGPTRNPWSLSRSPGGSSGGAAAAVAAGIVPAAHGSDGGGSIRIPASCCGLFGFKATRARLPDGPFAGEGWAGMAIDGFLTRSVRDAAALLDATAGADLGAPYWAPPMRDGFGAALQRPPRRLRVAVCDATLTGEPIHPDCRAAVADAARLLESLGHAVEPARPETDFGAGVPAMMRAWTDIVACGTALWVRQRLAALGRGLRDDDLEPAIHGAVRHAGTLSGADYLAAVETIHAFGRRAAAFFQTRDVLLTATLAEPPAELGRLAPTDPDYLRWRLGQGMCFAYSPFTAAFNATGQPAASLPLWRNAEGLPVGVHLAAGFGEDETLMALCGQIEAARPWFAQRPPQAGD